MAGPLHQPRRWWRDLGAAPVRRMLALSVLAVLVIAGVLAGLWFGRRGTGAAPMGGGEDAMFARVRPGNCLTWPQNSPDTITVVDCAVEHRFEVAAALDGNTDRSPAAVALGIPIHQVDFQQCQSAVGGYLGARYDPNGRYTVGVLWSPEQPGTQPGRQRMLCGLQLPGLAGQQSTFTGRVADLDQSRVWPAGTCLGVNPATRQSTDIPVDCSGPHAMEITGAVSLAAAFTGPRPADADQDAYISDACSRTTDQYLSPLALPATSLAAAHGTIALSSWTAGSRQVACRIGAPAAAGGWTTLLGRAKTTLSIDGQAQQAPAKTPSAPAPPPPAAINTSAGLAAPSGQPAPPAGPPPDQDSPDAPPPPGPPDNPAPPGPPDNPPQPGPPDNPPPPDPGPPDNPPPPEPPPAPPPPAPAEPATPDGPAQPGG